MKKPFVIIGIIVLLVTVGLSGCNNIGTTNIGDITANPQNYLNKTVTIEGTCVSIYTNRMIADDSGHQLPFKFQNSLNGRYRLTGVIKFETMYYMDVETANAIS